MGDDEMTAHETSALFYVQEANSQLRQLVHQYLTSSVTLMPDEALQAQRELAALSMGAAWLRAKVEHSIASIQDDSGTR